MARGAGLHREDARPGTPIGDRAIPAVMPARTTAARPTPTGGNRVPVIAQRVQADEDTMRDVIHHFNEIGLACLGADRPAGGGLAELGWAGGGRPDDEILLGRLEQAGTASRPLSQGTANTLAALKPVGAARPDGAPVYVILDNVSAHTGADIGRWAKKGKVTRSRRTSAAGPTPTIAVTPHSPGPCTATCAGARPTPAIRTCSPPSAWNAPVSAGRKASGGADAPSPQQPDRSARRRHRSGPCRRRRGPAR